MFRQISQGSRSIQKIPNGTDEVNAFPVTIVVSQIFSRSSTNSWVLTRRSRLLKLSSPHRTEVAFVFILLSAFPVTNNGIIACKPRSSHLWSPRLQQDWRNAWDSSGSLPLGPPLCCSAALRKPTHTFCTRKSQQTSAGQTIQPLRQYASQVYLPTPR